MLHLILTLLNIFDRPTVKLEPLDLFSWEKAAIFNLPSIQPDETVANNLSTYLAELATQGIDPSHQGIWLQSDWTILGDSQGKKAIPAASLTKIATTLAALGKWGADYRFETKIYHTGSIDNGVLKGDLIIEGSGDPFFVWEEAIALGNSINKLGIKEVSGNLIVNDRFYMNYRSEALAAAQLLQQGLDNRLWMKEVKQQYSQLPQNTTLPQVAIAGTIKSIVEIPHNAKLLIRHESLPLAEILKQMNIYSNNEMAQMLADLAGGAKAVSVYAAQQAKVPQTEVLLVNGSGLGEENRLSPRAVCQMLIAIDNLLQAHNYSATDLFPVAGRDNVGTIHNRNIPQGTAIKTGTLNRVSALAGIIPARNEGKIWFAIINSGNQTEYLRSQQDNLLQSLTHHWQIKPQLTPTTRQADWFLGDPSRNLGR
jgi:D-alanyl-D-alanine carboxypeptidase/D-alanyl-D-alanine-endopeptidase (penicillin-binding protein 4)